MNIEWRKVKNYENEYEVSNDGQVRRIGRKTLSHCLSRGHPQVILCKDGKRKHHYIHRLMLFAFEIPNPNNKTMIDHIDGNPENNVLSNLRWATNSENVRNSKVRFDNKLQEKNIRLKQKKYYLVKIRDKNDKVVFCKQFKNLEDAIKVRNEKLEEYYGEFARINGLGL